MGGWYRPSDKEREIGQPLEWGVSTVTNRYEQAFNGYSATSAIDLGGLGRGSRAGRCSSQDSGIYRPRARWSVERPVMSVEG